MTCASQCTLRRSTIWRMNITLLEETTFRDTIMVLRSKWKKVVNSCPNKVLWWDKYVKNMLRRSFQCEGAARNRDRKDLEDFYYVAIFQAIRNSTTTENTARTLRRMKEKILRLNRRYTRGLLMDMTEKDRIHGEDVTTYQYIRSRKRQMARTIKHAIGENGLLQTD